MSISPAKMQALRERLEREGIAESSLKEHFVRAPGKGGQRVNKVATCVVLRHEASGIEVKCSDTRSQQLNRYYARVRLCDRLEEARLGARSAEQQRREKIRRQKRKRSKRAKEKVLEAKKQRAELKMSRKSPTFDD